MTLVVATYGHTDFAMCLSRRWGFDLCPRMRELKQRHLFVPRGMKVPGEIGSVCQARMDIALINDHWDSLVNLTASLRSGHASAVAVAVAVLARVGSTRASAPPETSLLAPKTRGVRVGAAWRRWRHPSVVCATRCSAPGCSSRHSPCIPSGTGISVRRPFRALTAARPRAGRSGRSRVAERRASP
jgi:hypothetical protein